MLTIEATTVSDRDNQTFDLYDVEYEVVYRVEDPSGVSRTATFKNDIRRETERFGGVRRTSREHDRFVFESFAQYLAEAVFAP